MKNEELRIKNATAQAILHSSFIYSSFRNSDIFRIKSCRCDIFCVKNHKKTKIPPRFNNNHNKYQNYFINLQMQ